MSAEATPTTSALELLSPAARGRSLSTARSVPRSAPGKLRREPPRDDRDVVRPPDEARVLIGGIDLGRVAPPRVDRAHASVRPRRGDDGKSARHGGDERSPAGVVGVLAEDLDSPRHEPRPARRVARHAHEGGGRLSEERRAGLGLDSIEA